MFQLQDDGSHPADILRVLGGFRIEVAKLGDPFPFGARSYWILVPGGKKLECLSITSFLASLTMLGGKEGVYL